MKRVFSGIQPSGELHLGNYLGAITSWVNNQEHYENIFCIVNLHAITVKQDRDELRASTLRLANLLLASGINPDKSALFIQSEVDYHGALCWLLDCNINMGDMGRMTQFKDKSRRSEVVSVGLFNYPALMAADILLYQSDFVPVGNDQLQHIELCRDVAIRFNKTYGETFNIPNPLVGEGGARIMGLDDPTIKMSKSVKEANHAIFLLDSKDEIARKIRRATTDSIGTILFDKSRHGIYNLLCIYEALILNTKASKDNTKYNTKDIREEIEDSFKGKGYAYFKNELIDLIINELDPLQREFSRLEKEEGYARDILKSSLEKITPLARSTYEKAKEAMGLI